MPYPRTVQEDGVKSYSIPVVRGTALVVAAFILFIPHGRAQEKPSNDASSSNDTAGAVHDLQDQVHKLQVMVDEMRAENAQSRAEMHQLRQDLQATRALLESPSAPAGALPVSRQRPSKLNPPLAALRPLSGSSSHRRTRSKAGRINVAHGLEDRRAISDQS